MNKKIFLFCSLFVPYILLIYGCSSRNKQIKEISNEQISSTNSISDELIKEKTNNINKQLIDYNLQISNNRIVIPNDIDVSDDNAHIDKYAIINKTNVKYLSDEYVSSFISYKKNDINYNYTFFKDIQVDDTNRLSVLEYSVSFADANSKDGNIYDLDTTILDNDNFSIYIISFNYEDDTNKKVYIQTISLSLNEDGSESFMCIKVSRTPFSQMTNEELVKDSFSGIEIKY